MDDPEVAGGSWRTVSCCNCLGCLLLAVVALILLIGQMILFGGFLEWLLLW